MTNTKFTPGPWHLGQNGDRCARNHAICEGGMVIAKVYGCGFPAGEGWSPGSEANARLMAAAPVLLDACRDAFDALESAAAGEPTGNRDRVLALLKTAIDAAIPG